MTVWSNLNRRGSPVFRALRISYSKDLPNSAFRVEYPADARWFEKDLTIPQSVLGVLVDPRYGISTEGMSMEHAGRKILELLYQAIIAGDLDRIRSLCPTLSAWNDDLIKALLLGPDQKPSEVLEIRPVCKRGFSSLGPIVAVPCIIRTESGIEREDKIIVQFRDSSGKSSCVVYGPYGQSREID
jgi:hypothetical protein